MRSARFPSISFGVDLDAVWLAASEDLAVLKEVVERLLGRD
jgi:uncharacterized protein with HEPN domain